MKLMNALRVGLSCVVFVCAPIAQAGFGSAQGQGHTPTPGPRNIKTGLVIPDEGYSDQPYVVITNDGNWLCVLTTGQGVEGQPGQHIVATISSDKGRTWSPLIDIEPANGPEASWVMPLKLPSGRVYVFYTYNKDNLREVPNTNVARLADRADTFGSYMFKYSDDNGRTWSRERYEIPLRRMRIDQRNNFDGQTLMFWGVGKPIITGGAAFFGFAKVGKWGAPSTMVISRGCFLKSTNILTERDPAKIRWEVLPDGGEGLRAPKGAVADETNLVALSDGSLYATYRALDGYNCHAYSRDGGHTWTGPAYATYTPGGRRIKHPRAANFVRKFGNGKYLLWYHNNGGEAVHGVDNWEFFKSRNPAWIAGGVEKDGHIHWSQPEILLYDDDPEIRISYPDFIEDGGRYYVTETQKTVARVHEIDPVLLAGLWNQSELKQVARQGLVLDLTGKQCAAGSTVALPKLPNLREGRGFAIDFWVWLDELTPGQTILDARDVSGRGIALTTSNRATIKLTLNDGQNESVWDSDPGTHEGTLKASAWQHVAVIVDGGSKIISFVVDGVLNDGGAVRQYGWGRFKPELGDVNGLKKGTLAPKLFGEIKALRIYDRYLRTSEAVGNYRTGF